jgi:hypothetical protein
MSDQDELNPAELEFEAALKSLSPAATRLDPVSAAYEAGRRSVRSQVRVWQAAAAVLTLVGAGSWLLPSGQQLVAVEKVRVPTVVAVSRESAPISEQSMMMLQKAIWEKGVDGMSPVQLAPTKVIHVDEIISTYRGES